MITPTSMLPSPAMRNSRSCTCRSLAKARFTPCGLMNGAIPSNTRNSPSAASRSVKFTGGSASRALAPRRARPGGILQVLEEFAVRAHDQQVAVLAERMIISLHAAVEGIELGILGVGAGIGLCGGRITLAANAQRIALGIGEDHGALPFGRGADLGARLLPLGTQPVGGLGEALLHALVHPC